MDKVHKWIKTREEHPENKIKLKQALGKCFPNGPQGPDGGFVDIVVVSNEGVFMGIYADRLN